VFAVYFIFMSVASQDDLMNDDELEENWKEAVMA
jgi:hypothetical protein